MSPVLLKRDEEARRGFCPTVSHVPVGQGGAPEASRAAPAIRDSGVEVGAHHDGLCDSLARTSRKHDAVWVIVDRLTKSAHFLAVWVTFTLEEFCRLYIREIVRLHGVLVSIVLDRDPRFTTQF